MSTHSHVIDLTPFTDSNGSYDFRKITSGRSVVNDTDAIPKLRLGYDVKFSSPTRDDVKASFAYGMMEVLVGEFGEGIFDQVEFGWWCGKRHLEGFKRRQAKDRVKNSQPVWTPPFKFFIPQVSNQFRVEVEWKFDLLNSWRNRLILIEVYGEKSVKSDTFNGVKVEKYEKVTDMFALPGSIFKLSKMNFNKNGGDIEIMFYKGSAFNIDGQRVVLDKDMEFTPSICNFDKLTCSLNELSIG